MQIASMVSEICNGLHKDVTDLQNVFRLGWKVAKHNQASADQLTLTWIFEPTKESLKYCGRINH